MDYPRVSVVTVVFNDALNFQKTIDSVLMQTYQNIEYIVIDGCSTDGTLDLIKKYSKNIDFWISEPDRGIYDAMNKAIKTAKGDFIGFLNAGDCLCEKNTLEVVANRLKSVPDMDFLYGDIRVFSDNNSYVWKPNDRSKKTGEGIPHPSCFIKSSILKQELFDLNFKYAADYEIISRLIKSDVNKVYIDRVIVNYLAHGFSDTFYSKIDVFRVNRIYIGSAYAFKKILIDVLHFTNSKIRAYVSRMILPSK